MSKVLLINPDYYDDVFAQAKVRAAISRGIMPLGLLCVAAPLLQDKHDVRLLNLNLQYQQDDYLHKVIAEFAPDIVGITSTTPLIKKAYALADIVKRHNPSTLVVAGGPHPSALPEEVLRESRIDCVVVGEGEYAINRILADGLSTSIPNLYFKRDGQIVKSDSLGCTTLTLDVLPYPAYDLLDVGKYRQPGISSRRNPVAYMETSRGCYGRCIYCNKNIHGFKVRQKSAGRVVDEMERILKLGFREIQIIDDIFTANKKRAHTICEAILARGLKFPWYPRGGLRVDTVDVELLKIMKKAGCYRVPFGIESGSQRILEVIDKKITLEQAEKAVRAAKDAGLETECYFMIGLPTETEDDIKKSIDFAIRLNPDYCKFALTIPLPGTPMFDQMEQKGQIKTKEWEKFVFSTNPAELYTHDTLPSATMDRYLELSHRKFYWRLSYVVKAILRTIRNGTFVEHVKATFKTRW